MNVEEVKEEIQEYMYLIGHNEQEIKELQKQIELINTAMKLNRKKMKAAVFKLVNNF